MSIGIDPVERGSALSQFLAQGGSRMAARSAAGAEDGFTRALAESLERMGVAPGRIRVAAEPAGETSQPAAAAARRFVVTVEAAPSAEAASSEIPPYDPKRGPRITPEMWTEEMLTEDVSEELLRNMTDPAGFLNARLARLRQPTTARVLNGYDGSSTPLNPAQLSTREQAERVAERLQELGVDAGEINEADISGGPFGIDWGQESRRLYHVGTWNVGLVTELYAKYPVGLANQMILDMWHSHSTA